MNKKVSTKSELLSLRNVGPGVLKYLHILGIKKIEQLSTENADNLYQEIQERLQRRVDPCLWDTFAAIIHEAKTGERLPWWRWSQIRKKAEVKPINTIYPELSKLLSISISDPTEEKVQKVIASYNTKNHQLIGYLANEKLIGVIGINVVDSDVIILHISINPNYKLMGIGTKLIHYIITSFPATNIIAETGSESVNFYQKLGFICNSFNGKFSVRYKCNFLSK
jgi:N-acetylglutamate synthase-like GNAT family acetyltransferase